MTAPFHRRFVVRWSDTRVSLLASFGFTWARFQSLQATARATGRTARPGEPAPGPVHWE